jgi:fatty-acyl-CoA synthase
MEQIAEVAVIGVPDVKWGEVGCAVIAPKAGAMITIAEVSAFVVGKLAKFKQPAHVELVDVLPRNATGKVLKFELRQKLSGKFAE